ncbi:MAG TPA: hypothetical protein VFJ49_07050, partial [Methyloceanibacter sp.]|nr:hypothetical protein [Methyloceanibacter sp.]
QSFKDAVARSATTHADDCLSYEFCSESGSRVMLKSSYQIDPETNVSEVERAARFFIEQVLFHPQADSYRVLGARPQASTGELRRNMALLLRWVHPDHDQGERSIFARRVMRAWNDLKTDEQRAAYSRHYS